MKVDIGTQSQHYAGTAFDVAQTYSVARRNALRNSAINSGIWTYVEPASISPTWEVESIGKIFKLVQNYY